MSHQGQARSWRGTLLSMRSVLELSSNTAELSVRVYFQAVKTRFASALQNEDALVAAVTVPKFKLRRINDQARRDSSKGLPLPDVKLYKQGRPTTCSSRQHLPQVKMTRIWTFSLFQWTVMIAPCKSLADEEITRASNPDRTWTFLMFSSDQGLVSPFKQVVSYILLLKSLHWSKFKPCRYFKNTMF